jgi:small GTP-binding protein
MDQTLTKDYKMTIGVDISSKSIAVDNKLVTFSVNDLAGQKRFDPLKTIFFKGAQVGLLVFDLTRKDSLLSLKTEWIIPLLKTCLQTVNILIGNKLDLTDLRVIQSEEAISMLELLREEFPQSKFLDYVETSALQNTNVKSTFDLLGKEYLTYHAQ